VDLSAKAREIVLENYRKPLFEAISSMEKLLSSNVPNIKIILLLTPIERWVDLLTHYSSLDPSIALKLTKISDLSVENGLPSIFGTIFSRSSIMRDGNDFVASEHLQRQVEDDVEQSEGDVEKRSSEDVDILSSKVSKFLENI
jgi:hypothetical protein